MRANNTPSGLDCHAFALTALSCELQAFCSLSGLPMMSADELIHEDVTAEQRHWLSEFILRWEATEAALAATPRTIIIGDRAIPAEARPMAWDDLLLGYGLGIASTIAGIGAALFFCLA